MGGGGKVHGYNDLKLLSFWCSMVLIDISFIKFTPRPGVNSSLLCPNFFICMLIRYDNLTTLIAIALGSYIHEVYSVPLIRPVFPHFSLKINPCRSYPGLCRSLSRHHWCTNFNNRYLLVCYHTMRWSIRI